MNLPILFLLTSFGCRDRCSTYDDYGYGEYVDTGYYGFVDTGYYGYYEDYTSLEIGVGTRSFIEVPYDKQVSPEVDADGSHFEVALRSWGLDRKGLTVDLQAFVGSLLVAQNRHTDVTMKCRRWGELEVGSLRLDLEPQSLPTPIPPPTPVEPEPPPTREDTAWWVDTGYWVEPVDPRADVRVTATITERSGRETSGETVWFVYR